MNLSGILVVAQPQHLAGVISELQALPGVDVHHQDPVTGRIIVTQEAESVSDEVDGMKRIRTLSHVIAASMVYHRFDEDAEIIEQSALDDLDEHAGLQVPEYLNK